MKADFSRQTERRDFDRVQEALRRNRQFTRFGNSRTPGVQFTHPY